MFGQTQSHEEDGHLPCPLKNGNGADRSTFSDEGRLFSKSGFDGALGGLGIRTVEDTAKRLQHTFRLDLDPRILRRDELFEQLPRLDFIKCDVEGLELSVFRSFLRVIQKFKPVILCELGDPQDRKKMLDLLSPVGYGLYYLENKKLKSLDPQSSIQTVSHNHYFIPHGRREELAPASAQG